MTTPNKNTQIIYKLVNPETDQAGDPDIYLKTTADKKTIQAILLDYVRGSKSQLPVGERSLINCLHEQQYSAEIVDIEPFYIH